MKFLIVSLRYLGDCLLAASLAPVLKEHFPQSQVDILTFKDNACILEGIPGIDNVIGVEHHPKKLIQAKDHLASWNSYDWAFLAMTSTRTVLYGFFAAKHQVMFHPGTGLKELWMRLLIKNKVPYSSSHTLDSLTNILRPLLGDKIDPLIPVVPDRELGDSIKKQINDLGSYVVCHCCSRYPDKNWPKEHWAELLQNVLLSGKAICFTGGANDREYISTLTAHLPNQRFLNLAGLLSFGQTARVISKAVAYIGVDTATSHVAAATGVPCVCLFGPTVTSVWGPSPAKGRPIQFLNNKHVQTILNVTIVRRDDAKTECTGCTRHMCAHNIPPEQSQCMKSVSPQAVWSALCDHSPILR